MTFGVALLETEEECVTPGCERPLYHRGHCRRCYYRIREWFPIDCPRCAVQLAALDADGGRGDRALLAGTMTMAEASAYMLGFFDRRAQPNDDAIDPYIVQRFHEVRMEAKRARSELAS